MQFNSLQYLIFLPLIVVIYYLLPPKKRWILLLAGSYYFYMCWRVEYILLIMASTGIDFFCGIQMDKHIHKRKKLPFLILSLIVNIGLLFFFKYYNFAAETTSSILSSFNVVKHIPELKVLLPVGISFYTFQTLSYTIEVFKGAAKSEKHIGYFALYVSFFPQLVAGPIERFSRLNPQLKSTHKLSYNNIANGLRLILFGLFIKMVIADNLSVYVDEIYSDFNNYNSGSILLGIFFYSFQIYSDFYGYSIIAIGSARLLGINLMDNFKTPYLARNINEFWQRWHISLSSWFRDYLYLPLGGNKVSIPNWVFNILFVFLVSGLWHGANWTFVIWGGIFGIAYIAENITNRILKLQKKRDNFHPWHALLVIKTFLIVTIAWVFFRSSNLEQALSIFKAIFVNIHKTNTLQITPHVWVFLAIFITLDITLYRIRFDNWLAKFNGIYRWAIYILLLIAIIFYCGVENFPFIYFQF